MRKLSKVCVRLVLLGGFLLFLMVPSYAGFINSEPAQEKATLYIGYPASAFVQGLLDEMKVALEVWGSRMAERVTEGIKNINVTIFEDEDFSDIYDALFEKKIDVLIMNSLDYVEHERDLLMEPVFVGSSGSSIGYNYLLLVGRESGIHSLNQLKGKAINIETEGVGRMPLVWLDVLLRREGFISADSFFKGIHYVESSSKAVLPVFFKNVSACLTSQRAFQTMVELNPQLERELVILKSSPEFLRGVVIFRNDLEPEIKDSVSDTMRTMHEDPDGEQIMIVMREQRLLPYKEEYIENVKALLEEYRRLQKGPVQ